MEVGFSLGSNVGDRLASLAATRDQLLAQPGTTLLAQSPVYETEPVDVRPEFAGLKFLNAVLIVESEQSARDWLTIAHAIEQDMGRKRGGDRNAPRPIDIDILYAGQELIDGPDLVVPHPRWAEREFVVRPLADVRPHLVLGRRGRKVSEVLAEVRGSGGLRLFAKDW